MNEKWTTLIDLYKRRFLPIFKSSILSMEQDFKELGLKYDAIYYVPMALNIIWTKPYAFNINKDDVEAIEFIKEMFEYFCGKNYREYTEEEVLERIPPRQKEFTTGRFESVYVLPIVKQYYEKRYGFPNHGLIFFFMKDKELMNYYMMNNENLMRLSGAMSKNSMVWTIYDVLPAYPFVEDDPIHLIDDRKRLERLKIDKREPRAQSDWDE